VLEIRGGTMMLVEEGHQSNLLYPHFKCVPNLVAAGLGEEVILPDLVCVLEIMDYHVICMGSNLDFSCKKLEMFLKFF
jgi:hypothetical protein